MLCPTVHLENRKYDFNLKSPGRKEHKSNVRGVRSGLSIEPEDLAMVQQRATLHLLLSQGRVGERVRAGGDEEGRGGAADVPGDLRERVHGLEGGAEDGGLEEARAEGALVADGDGGRGEDGVERRELLAHEVVLGLGGERRAVCGEVGVPPPRPLGVGRRRRDGRAHTRCGCMDDGGDDGDGGGEGEACGGRVEVEDGRFAFCVGISWWLGGILLCKKYWTARARWAGSFDARLWLWQVRKPGWHCYGATNFLWNTVRERYGEREYDSIVLTDWTTVGRTIAGIC